MCAYSFSVMEGSTKTEYPLLTGYPLLVVVYDNSELLAKIPTLKEQARHNWKVLYMGDTKSLNMCG